MDTRVWAKYYDELNDRYYYYNELTKESRWDQPQEFVATPTVSLNEDHDSRLPVGWERHYDTDSNRFYYHNIQLNTTQWNPPSALQQIPDPAEPPPSVFEIVIDSQSLRPYYINCTSGESTWDLPAGARLINNRQSARMEDRVTAHRRISSVSSVPTRFTSGGTATLSMMSRKSEETQPQPVSRPAHSGNRLAMDPGRGSSQPPPPVVATPQASSPSETFQSFQSSDPAYRPALPRDLMEDLHQFRFEDFAHRYFTNHHRGIFFRRRVPVVDLMRWQKHPITRPLLRLPKKCEKDAVTVFKAIQSFMGDRESRMDPCAIAASIVQMGSSRSELRDEIYTQIKKQFTENPVFGSERRGWVLMAMCCSVFPPTRNLEDYVLSEMKSVCRNSKNHQVARYAGFCAKAISRTTEGKPFNAEFNAKIAERYQRDVFATSQFDCSLDEIMVKQSDEFPDEPLPRALTFLIQSILASNGESSEGVFRLPANETGLEIAKTKLERGEYSFDSNDDPHIPASLLKLWLRNLTTPVVPESLYDSCLGAAERGEGAVMAVVESLPAINRAVLAFVCNFLRSLSRDEVVAKTKMPAENLALVFCPNILKGTPSDTGSFYKDTEKMKIFMLICIRIL